MEHLDGTAVPENAGKCTELILPAGDLLKYVAIIPIVICTFHKAFGELIDVWRHSLPKAID